MDPITCEDRIVAFFFFLLFPMPNLVVRCSHIEVSCFTDSLIQFAYKFSSSLSN